MFGFKVIAEIGWYRAGNIKKRWVFFQLELRISFINQTLGD